MDISYGHNLKYKDCLSKYVRVETLSSETHAGRLKSMDPLTGDLVLVMFTDNKAEVVEAVPIMGSEYKSIEVLEDFNDKMSRLIQDTYVRQLKNTDDIIHRKNHLVDWIRARQLPVHEAEDGTTLVVCGDVTVRSPYNVDSCSGSDEKALTQIRDLISSLPNEKSRNLEIRNFVRDDTEGDESSSDTDL